MSHKHASINDTVYFWLAANDTSGSGGDGASPLFDVREAGAAAGAIPLLSGTPTLLTHANYPAGCHEIAVAATTGNGFAADDTFAVFCTLAIDSQNPTGFVGSCTLTPIPSAAAIVNEWETQSQADPTGFHVNVLEVGGTAQTANDNGADINTILSRIIGTLASGTHNPASTAQLGALTDWIDGGRLDLLLDAIPTTAMRGTDSAALASAWTATRAGYIDELAAANIPADIDTLLTRIVGTLATGTHYPATAAQIAVLSDWINAGRLDVILDAIKVNVDKVPLSDGSLSWNSTALAAINAECDTSISDASLATAADLLDKLGAVNESAAAGDPSATESVMQYVKQIVNVLVGSDGVTTYPSAAAPANNVSLSEIIRAIYDDSNELQGDWANGGRLDLLLDRLITELDTARGEPAQGAPAVSTKIADKIDYLYKALRNKTEQTATTLSIYNDAGTVVDHKATVSDDGTTATNGEIVTGP